MKIGIFSDSHDHLPNIAKVVDIFLDNNVNKIVHCGDLVAPFIVRALKKLENREIETIGVFGNNDGERANMNKILRPLMEIKGDFHEMEWEGVQIAIYHGTDRRILENLSQSGLYDVVLCGHTHQLRVEKIENTLLINPGETCGYLTGRATCAILDLERLNPEDVEIVDI